MKPKTIPQLTEVAAELLQLLVRLKAANWNGYVTCCTCGVLRHYKDRMHGGHFIGRHWTATRLVEENIHPQCAGCNGPRKGEPIAYTLYMIDMYGREMVDYLLALKGKTKKYKKPEINKLITELKGRIKVEEARLDTNSINDVAVDDEKRRYDLTLPYPPSIEECQTHTSSKGQTRVMTRDSDKMTAFQRAVYDVCQFKNLCTLGNNELKGRKIEFTIFAYPSSEGRIGCISSAILEAIKISGVYKNDGDVQSVRIIRKGIITGGKVQVVVKTV